MVARIIVDVVQSVRATGVGGRKVGNRGNENIAGVGQQFIADFHFRTRIDKREGLDRRGTNHLGVRSHVFPRRVGKIVHLEGRLFAVFFIDERHFFFTAHCLFDLRAETVAGKVHQREIVQRIERHTDHVDQRKERKQPLCVA